jgi:hypothetical protein
MGDHEFARDDAIGLDAVAREALLSPEDKLRAAQANHRFSAQPAGRISELYDRITVIHGNIFRRNRNSFPARGFPLGSPLAMTLKARLAPWTSW